MSPLLGKVDILTPRPNRGFMTRCGLFFQTSSLKRPAVEEVIIDAALASHFDGYRKQHMLPRANPKNGVM